MTHSNSPEARRVGWWEIIFTILLKTLPLAAITALSLKYAHEHVQWVSRIPSALFNGALVISLLFVARVTAGKMLRTLIEEDGGGK